MRENRTYGSEGGDRLIICSLPLSNEDSSGANHRPWAKSPIGYLFPTRIRSYIRFGQAGQGLVP